MASVLFSFQGIGGRFQPSPGHVRTLQKGRVCINNNESFESRGCSDSEDGEGQEDGEVS